MRMQPRIERPTDRHAGTGQRASRGEVTGALARRLVLCVEDNEADFELVRLALPCEEFVVEWTPTAARARQALGTQRFDVVLLDHGLPDANALTFIDEIRDLQPAVPVVILTGWNEEALVVSSRKKGAADFVHKDELARDLLVVVRRVLMPPPGRP